MTRVGNLLPDAIAGPLPDRVTNRRANWFEVARKDLADARQSWLLSGLGGLFVALVAGMGFVVVSAERVEIGFALGLSSITVYVIRWFVPLTALVVGSLAVVGEREAGSLRLLLGLPISRRDVVVGKLLGRTVALSATLSGGLVLAAVEGWYLFVGFDLGAYASFIAETLVLGSVFVSIGVGISALSRSRARAMGASIGVFVLVRLVWHVIPDGVLYLRTGEFPDEISPLNDLPAWFIFLGNVNPINGIFALFREWTSGYRATLSYEWYSIEAPGPFYLQPEFLLLVVVLWALVPLVLGAWRFSRSDFG